MLVKKPQEQPLHCQHPTNHNDRANGSCMFDNSLKEETCYFIEVYKLLKHVYYNRIHPNNNKEERPLLVLLDLNDPVDNSKE